MGISVKFDHFEDRMKLLVDLGDNTYRPLCFRRFQWLNLIFSLRLLAQTNANFISNSSEKKVANKNNINKKNIIKKSSELLPLIVKDVRVRIFKNKFKLIISSSEESPIVLTMPNANLELLLDSFLDIAEKVGWDPSAALERINFEQKSRLAIKDIMKKKKLH